MREPDLVPLVARCFQNFMDVENHDPNTCYVPPSLETLDERAKQSYLNDALFHRKVDTIVYVVSEHITALRSQVAELQRSLETADEMNAICENRLNELRADNSELQRQLDEAARPEESVGCTNGITKQENGTWYRQAWVKGMECYEHLYAKPINLPALIEQAKAEEREEAMKIVEAQRQKILNNPSDPSWTEYLAEVHEAIRARKP